MAAAAPAADPGTRLGERYRLVECVRVDGDRQSWRAVDELLRRPVQVWLHRGLDLDAAAALRRRVQALHRVRHPGLVTVYDLVDQEDEVAVITAPGAGVPLSELLQPGRLPSLGTTSTIVSSLAEILDDLYVADHALATLSAADVLLRPGGAAILDAPLAARDESASRPDVRALEELTRGLVLGSPPRPGLPEAVRLAVEELRARPGRTRSARDHAGELAAAIAFDDRTEVLPRDRWVGLRRASERARARAVAVAMILSFSVATGGIVASATTRAADQNVPRQGEAAPEAPVATVAPAARVAALPPVASTAPLAAGRGMAPSVVGLPRDEAAAALMAAGAGSVTWRIDPKAKGVTQVVRQDPPAGQPLARGTKATLYLDSAKAR